VNATLAPAGPARDIVVEHAEALEGERGGQKRGKLPPGLPEMMIGMHVTDIERLSDPISLASLLLLVSWFVSSSVYTGRRVVGRSICSLG
jgi:hypothetical protein